MIIPILVSALASVAFDAAPAANPAPLREVRYKVSAGTRTYSGGEHYEGYSSRSNSTTDDGTVTVDITAVQGSELGIRLTELLHKTGHESVFTGAVMPDGLVSFPPESISEVSRELLQYFAPQFMPIDKIDVGASWDANASHGGVDIRTNYKITRVDGPLITLAEKQTVKIATQNVSISSEGTITLKPSLLVPINGDVRRVISRLTLTGNTTSQESLHFERTSDSRDVSAK